MATIQHHQHDRIVLILLTCIYVILLTFNGIVFNDRLPGVNVAILLCRVSNDILLTGQNSNVLYVNSPLGCVVTHYDWLDK